MSHERVVVTGVGVVSPLGIGGGPFWTNVLAAETGVKPIAGFAASRADALAGARGGEVAGFDPKAWLSKKGLRNLNRSITFARTAARFALEDAGFVDRAPDPAATGVVLGTNGSCTNQMLEFDRDAAKGFVDPLMFPNTGVSAPACQISVFEGYHSQTSTLSSGHAAGLEAIGVAASVLRAREATLVIAGGVEELCEATYGAAWWSGRLYRADADGGDDWPGPFGGAGVVMGEGGACLILEREPQARERGAAPWAEIRGVASGFDPDVIARRTPRVESMVDVVMRALDESGITAADVDCVVSGAQGDPASDAAEAEALRRLFGERRVPVMAVCAQTGDAHGATGAFQAAAAALALRDGRLGGRAPRPNDALDLVHGARPFDGRVCLLTSFGSLGERIALVMTRLD